MAAKGALGAAFLQDNPVIAIVGPTASGKSDLAQELALAIGGEVLSADSMQIYRGMDIGTGKLLPSQQKVSHWGLDLVEPGQSFSVAVYQEYGRQILDKLDSQKLPRIVCGGTGFYIRALIDDFSFPAGDQENNPVRERYNRFLECNGAHALWEELRKVDPASAEVIHENDSKRVVRAFELLADGTSYAARKQAFAHIPQHYPAIFIGLQVTPAVLNNRIDRRVDAMLQAGLLDEVNTLLKQGFREGLTAPQAIGYKEIVAYLDGECSLEQAVREVKIATHRYAKRQRTWFRKDERIHWLGADDFDLSSLTQQALALLQGYGVS